MKPSNIGGMAVMEGVMMKHKDQYAVAVRKPNNEIVVEKSTYTDFSDKVKLFKLPIFRGMLAFVESVVVGAKVLNYSTSFFEEEEELKAKEKNNSKRNRTKQSNENKRDKNAAEIDDDFEIDDIIDDSTVEAMIEAETKKAGKQDKKSGNSNAVLTAVAILLSIVLSVALFLVLPVIVTDLLTKLIPNKYTLAFIEGMMRLAIFIIYALLAMNLPEIKRVFMYHGAEHKAINCLEHGLELTVENVKGQSKRHKCCATGFLLFVIIVSLIIFILLPIEAVVMRIINRVILFPLIAGISYEFFLLAGKSEARFIHILSLPGLWMQGLTTKEPDDEMIEVAIQSVGAVFDWKTFLGTSSVDDKNSMDRSTYPKEKKGKNTKAKGKTKASVLNMEESSVIKEVAITKEAPNMSKNNRNQDIAPVPFKPVITDESEEEDDEILKALDKFFDGQSI